MKSLSTSVFLAALLLPITAPAFAQQGGVGANYETRLSTLEDELRALNGQVEQLGFSIRRLDQNVQRMQSDYDARLAKLETTVSTLTANDEARNAAAAAKATSPGALDGTLGAIRTQDGRVTGAISNPQAPPLPDAPADLTQTPQEEYERAFGMLRQASYDDAEKAFKAFIDKNPKDKMIDNAKYWYAETLYVRGRFADASVGFADAFQQNPQGQKAPDSLLKLAMSQAALNKLANACTALSELKAKYPNASPTVKIRANEERVKLKCT
jgi:tol-pal system protein YbgF